MDIDVLTQIKLYYDTFAKSRKKLADALYHQVESLIIR